MAPYSQRHPTLSAGSVITVTPCVSLLHRQCTAFGLGLAIDGGFGDAPGLLRWYRARPSSSTRSCSAQARCSLRAPKRLWLAQHSRWLRSTGSSLTFPLCPKLSLHSGGIFAGSHQPTHTPLAARTCRQCTNTHFAMSKQLRWWKLFHRSFRLTVRTATATLRRSSVSFPAVNGLRTAHRYTFACPHWSASIHGAW